MIVIKNKKPGNICKETASSVVDSVEKQLERTGRLGPAIVQIARDQINYDRELHDLLGFGHLGEPFKGNKSIT